MPAVAQKDTVCQGAVDRYISMFGPADIERWKADGVIEIEEENKECGQHETIISKK